MSSDMEGAMNLCDLRGWCAGGGGDSDVGFFSILWSERGEGKGEGLY